MGFFSENRTHTHILWSSRRGRKGKGGRPFRVDVDFPLEKSLVP
jgi:hypothetical protein